MIDESRFTGAEEASYYATTRFVSLHFFHIVHLSPLSPTRFPFFEEHKYYERRNFSSQLVLSFSLSYDTT